MFVPMTDLQSAFGEKLTESKSDEAMIHASGKDFDYFHCIYDSAQTSKTLRISYYTFSSARGAVREFDALSERGSVVQLRKLGQRAKFFPKGKRPEDSDANLVILQKNTLIAVRSDHTPATKATLRRLERVARLVLNPQLRGTI